MLCDMYDSSVSGKLHPTSSDANCFCKSDVLIYFKHALTNCSCRAFRQLGARGLEANRLTGYCFKYIDRPFCLQTDILFSHNCCQRHPIFSCLTQQEFYGFCNKTLYCPRHASVSR